MFAHDNVKRQLFERTSKWSHGNNATKEENAQENYFIDARNKDKLNDDREKNCNNMGAHIFFRLLNKENDVPLGKAAL